MRRAFVPPESPSATTGSSAPDKALTYLQSSFAANFVTCASSPSMTTAFARPLSTTTKSARAIETADTAKDNAIAESANLRFKVFFSYKYGTGN